MVDASTPGAPTDHLSADSECPTRDLGVHVPSQDLGVNVPGYREWRRPDGSAVLPDLNSAHRTFADAELACDELMTATGSSRPVTEPRRRRWGAGIALTVVVGSLVAGVSAVRADQTVYFDGAGNAPHISLIGDSTLTGVRWYADYGALQRFNFVLSAESCRRTIERSCISREGYRSANVITAMHTLDGDLGEVLVVMSGYNDPIWTIDEAIAEVVEEARAQGVRHVVWLSLRTSDDVDYSDPQQQSSINTFREYNEQLVEAAATSDGYLQVADWATYSNGASGWFETDGVHLSPRGVDAITTFVAGTVERVLSGQDVSPAAAPWTVLVPGAEGEMVESAQEALIAAGVEVPGGADGVYGNDTMSAVAAYQRRQGDLQVTGAVDVATARSLGVYEDPDADDEATTTTALPATTVAAATVPAPARAATVGVSSEPPDSDGGLPRWPLVAASAVVALAAAVAGRRRYVVAQRAARRWARVHPATSPRRSVADMRRAGELPTATATGPAGRIYDHELEQPAARASTATGDTRMH
jgi:peptidoglycan hydrolase-like protein with peptidoglycan-binding domain